MEYIAIAIAPGIAICLFIFYKDIYNREPRLNLIVSFFLGCAAIIPAILFEDSFGYVYNGTVTGVALYSYAVVAFSEEFSKFLGLRLYSYRKKSFDEPLDGIVYSVMVGMGFATLENIMYVMKYAEIGQGLQVGIKRMFLSVPAHGTFAVVMGYFVGKAKFNSTYSFFLMLAGLLGAVFFHGTFDFFLFVNESTFWGRQTGEGLLAVGALISFVISLVLCRKLIRKHRNISKEMFKDKSSGYNA
jgi:RsiW-degrading membrane proteinase PrsW (M82 family)